MKEINDMKNTIKNISTELQELKYALDQTAIIAMTDLAGRITFANDLFCKISKYSREELIGKTHSLINSGFHNKEFFEKLWQTISAGKIWKGEIKNRAKDGSFYWVDTTIVPFRNSSGEVYQYVSIRYDITEKKQIQEMIEIERANRFFVGRLAAVGEMASNIGHEIKNPLTVILMKAQMMKRTVANGSSTQKSIMDFVDSIAATAIRIDKIISSVRSLGRDAYSDPFEFVDLKYLVEETLDFVKPRFIRDQINLIVELPSHARVQCRPVQISQILLNLLNNACDAVCDVHDKWVKVKVIEQDNDISIRVDDSGVGIAAENHSKVMTPFFTTKEVGRGTGLGLSISKSIVESHGGTLKIDASAANTSFVVSFPRFQSYRDKISDKDFKSLESEKRASNR